MCRSKDRSSLVRSVIIIALYGMADAPTSRIHLAPSDLNFSLIFPYSPMRLRGAQPSTLLSFALNGEVHNNPLGLKQRELTTRACPGL